MKWIDRANNYIKESLEDQVNIKDELIRSLTLEDLIIAVQSNEPEINEESVMRTFQLILSEILEDAKSDLKNNMEFIIREASQ